MSKRKFELFKSIPVKESKAPKVPRSIKSVETHQIIQGQAYVRGFLARKHYRITALDPTQSTKTLAHLVGNDPVLPLEGKLQEKSKKIAVIATSGLRAISVACTYGNAKNTPKLIIVDNSAAVVVFWRKFRQFVCDFHGVERYFLRQFKQFLQVNKDLYRSSCAEHDLSQRSTETTTYLNQDPYEFMSGLIDTHGFDFVTAVIKHSTILAQSWTNPDVLMALKNIITCLGIKKTILYPSNIVACSSDKEAMQQLANIEAFKPTFSIQTDLCPCHVLPEQAFIFKNNQASQVALTLFGHPLNTSLDEDSSEKRAANTFAYVTNLLGL